MKGRLSRAQRWLPLLIVLCSSSVFFLAGRHSTWIVIDSGPYVSVAHHLVESGRPESSFNFVGNFERLPGVPNFIAPGLGLMLATLLPLTRDVVLAGQVLLFLALLGTQVAAFLLVRDQTGAPGFAAAASLVLVANVATAGWAATLLTELPFIACLTAVLLVAGRVLEGRAGPRQRLLVLPALAAALALTRFIGVFFLPVFAIVYFASTTPGARRSRKAGYLLYLGSVALSPLVAWLWLARADSPTWMPDRPPAVLSLGRALLEAGGFLVGWAGPWILVGLALLLLVGRATARDRSDESRPSATRVLLVLAVAAYVALLVAIRTRVALIPVDHLGARYFAPVWPMLCLAGAVLIHRRLWRRGPRAVRVVLAAMATIAVGLGLHGVASVRVEPVFPTQTETFEFVVGELGREEVVLCNYGQPLVVARPDARIIGIPSRRDFRYRIDLPSLVKRHELGWIVLFAHPKAGRDYGSWFDAWSAAPPAEVAVARTWRFRDGVVYRLARPEDATESR